MKVLVLLIATSLLLSQEREFIGDQGFGARAKGMGNAFTAVSDDATAIAWNPAGLTNLYGTEISINGQFRFGNYSYELANAKDDFTAEKTSNFELNFLSVVHPIKLDFATLVFGVAYRSLYNWNDELEILRNDEVIQHHVKEGGIKAFTVSTGVQLLNFAAIGISFNNLSGTLDSYNAMNDNTLGSSIDYSGSFMDVGAQLKFTDAFKLGYKASLPFNRNHEVSNDILINGTKSESNYFEIPRLETFGLAIQFSDNSTFSVDYKRHPWSLTEATIVERNNVKFRDLRSFDIFKYDLNSIHFGYESLSLNSSNNNSTSWRFGYFTKPYQEEDINGDQIINPVLTGGFGLSTDALAFDISAQFEIHDTEIGKDAVYKGVTFFLNTTLIFYL